MTTSFSASMHSLKIDDEGESRLILKVPASDLKAIIALTGATQELLTVKIETQ